MARIFRGLAAPLGPQEIRRLADNLGLRPTKTLGQNFVHDANTVRRIVTAAGVGHDDAVLEVGPGLGSLTLPLLDAAGEVIAVEIDPVLADRLPLTVTDRAPELADRLTVLGVDALRVTAREVGGSAPTKLVANLPYNVSVPVLLHLLQELSSLRTGLVMVQAEVADRLAAGPGSRVYGIPSVKAGWYGRVRGAGSVGRQVFWPVPNVDSKLVRIDIYDDPPWPAEVAREMVFGIVDAAFAQRRKTLRAALATWAGSAARAEEVLVDARIEPRTRGEQLATADFVQLAASAAALGIGVS